MATANVRRAPVGSPNPPFILWPRQTPDAEIVAGMCDAILDRPWKKFIVDDNIVESACNQATGVAISARGQTSRDGNDVNKIVAHRIRIHYRNALQEAIGPFSHSQATVAYLNSFVGNQAPDEALGWPYLQDTGEDRGGI
jgi:hypothetical protein